VTADSPGFYSDDRLEGPPNQIVDSALFVGAFDVMSVSSMFWLMPTRKSDDEDAVRSYLLYLDDPAALRDEAEIAKRHRAVVDATDPIDKLKAIAALERASTIDETALRDRFVTHAKAWAEAQGVPLSAFRQLKVPDDVLREAGFRLPAAARQSRASRGRRRARAVPVEDVKAHILAQKGSFVLADVMNTTGGSQATARKAIDELIAAGQVEKLGPVPNYKGRGRAPLQYKQT